jgi:hypothetical protein
MRVSYRRGTSLVLLCSLTVPTACSTVIGIDGNYSDSGGATTAQGGSAQGGSAQGGGNSSGGSGNANGGSATCSGAPVNGLCWYLGELGQSCTGACSSHGGESPEAASFVGTPAQGGSWTKCAGLLSALGNKGVPLQTMRSDGSGLGCHYYGDRSYWLYSPRYSSSAENVAARLVCGCTR